MAPHVAQSISDLNSLPLPALFDALTADGSLDRLIDSALHEDLGEELGAAGDVTSQAIIEPDRRGVGLIVSREQGVIAGLAAAPSLLKAVDPALRFAASVQDGQPCADGQTLARVEGPLRSILTAERTMLNLLGRLSGIATTTSRYVRAIAEISGGRTVICDTRKTTPGLRALEKYAVRCGGGTMHRLGLHDAALFKDNHLAHIPPAELTAELNRATRTARADRPLRFVQVEVDSTDQLRHVLACEQGLIDMVLLDNMTTDQLRECVRLRNSLAPGIKLEASGGIDLTTVRAAAQTGVDRISVGALTHGATWLDIALDVQP